MTTNPLIAEWTGPLGGVPPYGRFDVSDIAPALEAAMADKLAQVERIADDPSPPSFDNTIVELERSGRTLDRVGAVYGVYTSTMNDDAVQAIERTMAPRLAALDDAVTQSSRLFARIAAVYADRERLGLTPEEKRLVWLDYTAFTLAGARLDDTAKARLTALNQRLAALTTTFTQNLLVAEGTERVVLEDEADLDGLPASLRDAAAVASGEAGRWAILNTRSSVDPFLTYSSRRDLRERVWRMFIMRGDGGPHDNAATIVEILKARTERARLLGYPTHAHWHLENTMARTPERAVALMDAVWGPAVERAREEVRDMQAVADREKAGVRIAPWDYRFYAEKVRKARYDVDQNEVKPYLALERLREAMFWVAGELFELQFTEVTDGSVPVYEPDVRVFRVTRAGGAPEVGLWYFDPYARPGKSSGAWMNEYRAQSRFDGDVRCLVSNNANFVKGRPGEPVLVSWDDARTLFHEFGHALHGLSSSVTYPSLAGTAVARDYVEFPSQLLEHWLATPEVLGRFALHHETGEPIPPSLVAKIARSQTFNQGFSTVEYLAAAIVDMKLHLAGDAVTDPGAFERATLASLGMPPEIVMRHRTTHFQHVFGGDGYSAGYYSYLWADTLSADAFEAFAEAGGPYDKAVAKRLSELVFRVGNTVDPGEGYRAFRGRDAGVGALMRARGFPVPPRAGER